ncbi:MAG: hypothetical protein EU530_03105 [Promethearchaeota archaeon]|nr:MAG: hypothetical protein EU530_03105 [Candidatus Lokiarchaeota archaeon]
MSKSNPSLRKHLIGHSLQIQKVLLCVFGIALVFFASFIMFNPPNDTPNQLNQKSPSASIRTITGNITLTSISETYVSDGEGVTLNGYALKWNGAAWDAYVGEIVLVVNGDIVSSEVTNTDGLGNFALPFTADADTFLSGLNYIQANTTQGGYDTNCSNQLDLYLISGADIQITANPQPTLSGSTFYPVSGVVEDTLTGSPYTSLFGFDLELWYGDIGTGTQGPNITVSDTGYFYEEIPHNAAYEYYTLNWPGTPALSADTSEPQEFNIITGIEVDFDNIGRTIYQNTNYSINGNVVQAGGGYALNGSYITITLTGDSVNVMLYNGTLSVGGRFLGPYYLIPNITGTYTITVTVLSYYSNGNVEVVPGGILIYQQTVRIRAPTAFTNLPWEFIVIGVGAVGVIVGIFFFQRWLMKKRAQKDIGLLLKEIEDRLNNVRMLYKMGRVKEALAYLYVTYTEIAQLKFGIEKEASQTTTEFAIIMVKQFGQNPRNIYPFIQEIEQVIYGGYPFNDQVFLHTVEVFGRIYLELMDKPLPSFQLN